MWSGSIKSPDAGIDVEVDVPIEVLDTGFLARPHTIFQAKQHTMPASAITSEMRPEGALSSTISRLASESGSYVIACLADDCSPTMRRSRISAMYDALGDDENRDKLHLAFFDRSKLLQWLRQHPAVVLWTRDILGQAYSGWRPYGAWSNPPSGSDDTLISASGVSIFMPTASGARLSIGEAIEPMRDLIRSTTKAIRFTGLSGTGKTRLVQALFDESVGQRALDRTIAIYVDTAAGPAPSATAMLDRLIAEDRRAIMVLDNCPSDLHSVLAPKVSSAESKISLITVEYDIRDDKPQTTDVIHIVADGPELAEQLTLRRFPEIGHSNARKIASFANGNARVALAVAERVGSEESLAHLSDAQLFDRLFEQRNGPNGELRAHAEVLSLVYSFSVSPSELGIDELEILGGIYGIPRVKLFKSAATLLKRGIAQKRSQWRAILPHVIANRLAGEALDSLPVDLLRTTFENSGSERLLMSFGHRLGMMHDHPIAQEIVEAWLKKDGLLGDLFALSDTGERILDYVAPVAPSAILQSIEADISSDDFDGMDPIHSRQRTTILRILQSLAYDPSAFETCVSVLLRVADFEDVSNNYEPVRDKIVRLFQPYLSGTHASLDQRLRVVRKALTDDREPRRSLGYRMLSAALSRPPWFGAGADDFGARPRDFGANPSHEALTEWRGRFIDLAVETDLKADKDNADAARTVLAEAFLGLWDHPAIRGKLIEAAEALNDRRPWTEGWRAVRAIIYLKYRKQKEGEQPRQIPAELDALEAKLAPVDLLAKIETYVLGRRQHLWELDEEFDPNEARKFEAAQARLQAKAEEFGRDFARSSHTISTLRGDLFSNNWMPNRAAFGRGLAHGSEDYKETWLKLVQELRRRESKIFDFSVLTGFINGVSARDRAGAQRLLDQCRDDDLLRLVLVDLHPLQAFSEEDLDRCEDVLRYPEVEAWMYGPILWRDSSERLPEKRLLNLAELLLAKTDGDAVVLDALSMRLHETNYNADTLGHDFRRIGLKAAIQRLPTGQEGLGQTLDYSMARVVGAALTFRGNDDLKAKLLDVLFSKVDDSHGSLHSFDDTIRVIATKTPDMFLDRIFCGDDKTLKKRRFFIERSGFDKPRLGDVDVNVLINWCRIHKRRKAWPVIAASLHIWEDKESGKIVALSNDALKFLEESPDPEEVLRAYASKIEPTVSSGNRVDLMELRVSALAVLNRHTNREIASAAKKVADGAMRVVEHRRQSQKLRDEKREQTFE